MSESTLVTARNAGEPIGGDLEVAIVQVHPIVVVRVAGDVVGGTGPLLRSVFETALAVDVPSVEVDLERARLFDSHGLAALEELCSAVLCHGRSLVLRGLGSAGGCGRGEGASCHTSSGGSRAGVGVLAGFAR
ncbi:STAS domain-containing protein [Parafrankia elaeagni]|uniref:STAS domain-containing protein n=1 Tax=Parafrankia elaeagni TaxID=222534 RepID=UPI00035C1E93|nr:STAS domain-containing protein [Parafrankia elaeagni]